VHTPPRSHKQRPILISSKTIHIYQRPLITLSGRPTNPSNARTAHLQVDLPTPCSVTIQPDRTFTFTTRTPPTTYFLKKASGIDKGSGKVGNEPSKGTVTLKHIYEIAKIKCMDEHVKAVGEEMVAKQVVATAKSLGLNVVP